MNIKFVKHETAKLLDADSGSAKTKCELLWGDRVHVLQSGSPRTKIRARNRIGWIRNSDLGDQSLLEIYFIDVGQGDGVFIRTPDHRHLLIDGGFPRRNNATGKNAADFVDWKFKKDYREDQMALDAVICSHNDADHYGGLWDLLNPKESHELDIDDVRVERFYHAGLSWWKGSSGRTLGPFENTSAGKMFTRLISDRASVVDALKTSATHKLHGEWAKFLRCVRDTKTRGNQPTPIERLSHVGGDGGYIPGFDATDDVRIKILAPVEFDVNGDPAIRRFPNGDSKNTNGNSLLFRLDFDRVRVLLTGDLNTHSQHSLLQDYAGEHEEFLCDVAKACHHGSHDVSYEFLEKMEPAVTVISSGDNEGHDHPRPEIVAASATTGFLQRDTSSDQIITPLVYSTELARSVSFGNASKLDVPNEAGTGRRELTGDEFKDSEITFRAKKSGDRNPKTQRRSLTNTQVMGNLIYGLVNVRTDGDKILIATLGEKDAKWKTKVIHSRFKRFSSERRS